MCTLSHSLVGKVQLLLQPGAVGNHFGIHWLLHLSSIDGLQTPQDDSQAQAEADYRRSPAHAQKRHSLYTPDVLQMQGFVGLPQTNPAACCGARGRYSLDPTFCNLNPILLFQK